MITTFTLTATLTIALLGAVVWSIARPAKRLWPPPRQTVTAFALLWLVTALISAGLLAVGVYDWNPHGLPAALRWSVGGGLFVLGHAVAWTAAFQTGLLAVAGQKRPAASPPASTPAAVIPSTSATWLMVTGWTALCASPWVAALALLCAAVFVLFPWAEEPWLVRHHGDTYRNYRRRVPRFVGWRSLGFALTRRPAKRSFVPCNTA